MKKILNSGLIKKVIYGIGLSFIANTAFAQGLNVVTGSLNGQLPGVVDTMSAISYIAGVGFGIKCALKLKAHNESKGQIPISEPITLFVVAAILIALPSMLSIATETIFGAGNTHTGLAGSGSLRQIR